MKIAVNMVTAALVLLIADCAFGATITVVAPQEGAAKQLTVGNMTSKAFAGGALAPLRAVPNPGWVFAGWYASYNAEDESFSDKIPLANSIDWRSPTANFVVGDENVTLYARFVEPAEDSMLYDLASTFEAAAYDIDDAGRPILSLTNRFDTVIAFDSASLPTVAISGLPAGLVFDKSTLAITGTPSASGVYRVSVTAKNASGYSYGQIFYVRVENKSSEHIEGFDYSMPLGEEMDGYLEDLFDITYTNAPVRRVTLSGLPVGLSVKEEKFDETDSESYYTITGKPRAAGENIITCTVAFTDGNVESGSMLFAVTPPDPGEYNGGVEFSLLEGYSVGDVIDDEEYIVLGYYDSTDGTGVQSVSGLPPGIVVKKVALDGGFDYVLSGRFAKAGEYTVSVSVAYDDWEKESISTALLTRKILVGDSPGVYLSAKPLDAESAVGCRVTGGGVYSAGATAKLSATASAQHVFAGWCDAAGVPVTTDADDYRKPQTVVDIAADMGADIWASFILKSEDWISLDSLESEEFIIDTASNEPATMSFFLNSGSLPTLKFTNLPAGVVCSPSTEFPGEYNLSYDPATVVRKPAPGVYTVLATGTNVSRATDSSTFTVKVLNYVDEAINVKDDYGVLTPNIEMSPISLADAVDFSRGDTLTVSGLPTGLKYNDKNSPPEITGTPIKPGNYTITFSAKIVIGAVTNALGRVTLTTRSGTATAFITVKDFPIVSAEIDDAAVAAGNKVSGTGSFKAGTKASLRATATSGWVFAGWGENSGVTGLASLSPMLQYTVGTSDLTTIQASFIQTKDDFLYIDDPGVVALTRGTTISTNLIETLVETRSLPTITIAGLPAGLRFDAKTFTISGIIATTSKAGYSYVTVTAKNAGGYSFVRILKFAVLADALDPIPAEPVLPNPAGIDFSELDGLYTGDFCPPAGVDTIGFLVEPTINEKTQVATGVSAVTVSGLPTGLKTSTTIEDGCAEVLLVGTPTKVGRYSIKVAVTYSDRTRAQSEYAFNVQDGGSAWLDVSVLSSSSGGGMVAGSGVYASGATVRLTARPSSAGYVFAGWYEDEGMPFQALAEMDGLDYRTANASFVFRRDMFSVNQPAILGAFVPKNDDLIEIDSLNGEWTITPSEDGEFNFDVNSASLPKLTATGLPKGVVLDAANCKLVYSCASKALITPGFCTISLKAVNQSGQSSSKLISVFVQNKTTDAIDGLSGEPDAYKTCAGVSFDPELVMPVVASEDGWKLAATGLPAGLALKSETIDGTINYYIAGVATRAATNTVTFTATKGTQKEVATITLCVDALPEFAVGTFDGAIFEQVEGETNAVGQLTVSITSMGKISGKILRGGKTYPFNATSFSDVIDDGNGVCAEIVVPWSPTQKETFIMSIAPDNSGLGHLMLESIDETQMFGEAVQNPWSCKTLDIPDFASVVKEKTLTIDDLTLQIGAKGTVTVRGKAAGLTVNGKTQILIENITDDGNEICAETAMVLYFANPKFEGGAMCETLHTRFVSNDGGASFSWVLK